jgi:hypothetical protein
MQDIVSRDAASPTQITSRLERSLTLSIFALYLAQVIYFILRVRRSVTPDEGFHVNMIEVWTKVEWFVLQDGPSTFRMGPVSRIPYLYHWLLSKWAVFGSWFGFAVDDLFWLRLCNGGIAGLGFWLAYRFLKTTRLPWQGVLLGLLLMTQTLMVPFIAAAVSYDNLVNTLAAACFLILAKQALEFSWTKYFLAISLVLIGCLTKIVFLPFCLAMVFALGVISFDLWQRKETWQDLLHCFKKPYFIGLVAFVGLLVIANCKLYLVNMLDYGSLYPACEQVLGEQTCTKFYAQSQRDSALRQQFEHEPRVGGLEFLKSYAKIAELRTVGIFAHQSLEPRRQEVRPLRVAYAVWIFLLGYGLWAKLRRREELLWWVVLGVTGFYASAVIYENYSSYVAIGSMGLGLQGRYLFPVLAGFAYLVHRPLFFIERRKIRVTLITILVVVYLSQGMRIYFLHPEARQAIEVATKGGAAP